jgi:hypothetical protein
VVVAAVSVSLQVNAGSLFLARAIAIVVRSSAMWTILMTEVWATNGLSVKVTADTPKFAVTASAALIVTVQPPAPVQAPVQFVNVEPATGVAVSVTMVLMLNETAQVGLQLMPAGVLVTVPLPAPALVTVRRKVGTVKLAVTVVAALIVTTQVPVPEQPPPLQPLKVDPAAATAVNVTWVPKLNEVEHTAPQLMPAGELLTVPAPLPDLFTVRAKDWTTKPAVTVVAAFMVTTHVPVPVHPPPVQPVKVDPAAGVAVSVTGVPLVYAAEQIEPQLMPAGLLETVPLPVPAF